MLKNWLYPSFDPCWLPRMLGWSLVGALIAGFYGALHDQISYSISPEYFTKLKFAQLEYADFGFSRRVYVAEVGFLATWWVGFVSAWFVCRMAMPKLPPELLWSRVRRAFAFILGCAVLAFGVGYAYGVWRVPHVDLASWKTLTAELEIEDLRSFIRVVWLHNASYAGGFVGLIWALLDLCASLRRQ